MSVGPEDKKANILSPEVYGNAILHLYSAPRSTVAKAIIHLAPQYSIASTDALLAQ